MDRKRKKALLWAMIVGFVLTVPIFLVVYLTVTDPLREITDLGVVPEFAYIANDGSESFTHFDTYKRVSLILNLQGDRAKWNAQLNEFLEIKKWADRALQNPNVNDAKPQHVNFVVMAKSSDSEVFAVSDQSVKFIRLEESEDFLQPLVAKTPEGSYALLVSQESRFAGLVTMEDAEKVSKIRRLLAKLTADAYLLHYLNLQSLMWKRASDYLRGKEISGSSMDMKKRL